LLLLLLLLVVVVVMLNVLPHCGIYFNRRLFRHAKHNSRVVDEVAISTQMTGSSGNKSKAWVCQFVVFPIMEAVHVIGGRLF
jgi:hypothetical protein